MRASGTAGSDFNRQCQAGCLPPGHQSQPCLPFPSRSCLLCLHDSPDRRCEVLGSSTLEKRQVPLREMDAFGSSLLRPSLCKGQTYIWPPSFSSIFPRSGFQRKHFTRAVITCRIDHFSTTTSIRTVYIRHLVFNLCISAPTGLHILGGADNCLPHNTQIVN